MGDPTPLARPKALLGGGNYLASSGPLSNVRCLPRHEDRPVRTTLTGNEWPSAHGSPPETIISGRIARLVHAGQTARRGPPPGSLCR